MIGMIVIKFLGNDLEFNECLAGSSGALACLASFFVCNSIFTSIVTIAGGMNVCC